MKMDWILRFPQIRLFWRSKVRICLNLIEAVLKVILNADDADNADLRRFLFYW